MSVGVQGVLGLLGVTVRVRRNGKREGQKGSNPTRVTDEDHGNQRVHTQEETV